MRTTLTLDDDVVDAARATADKLGIPFRAVVNRALRVGLDEVAMPAKCRPYGTVPHNMGLREGCSLDNIQELLATVEGEEFR